MGGRGGPARCYNCDKIGHVTWDCPIPRRPWCTYCRVNTHATEDCPKLITKWEDRNRQWETNRIKSEPLPNPLESSQTRNAITRGGA